MHKELLKDGLTYDDVLLIPKRSGIKSRKEIDLSLELVPGIKLNLPIMAAAMDTVCESSMAIALARMGALGIIHRFNTIEKQVSEIKKVKREENYFLENPRTVGPAARLKDLLAQVKNLNTSSFLVVDENNSLLGLISNRDYLFETDLEKEVKELMTPYEKLICVNDFISLEEAKNFFQKHKIEKLPVVEGGGKLKGLITAKDVIQMTNVRAVRDKKGRLLVGAAIGVRDDYLERARSLVEAGVDLLDLDIAHGHLEACLEATKILKEKFPNTSLMVGNIATQEGANDLREAGADIVKVGVGAGSSCITRIITGCGVPQLSAVIEAKKGAASVPIIADGGIVTSGDMVKALAAGASAVMLGGLLAGTDEAPGRITTWNGRKVKLYRGMASFAAYDHKKNGLDNKEIENFTAEGVDQAFVPYKGSVRDLLLAWEGGIRSGLSYCGAKNIQELWQKAEFIKISQASLKENAAHDVEEA